MGSSAPWQKLEGLVFYVSPSLHLTTAGAALCYCCCSVAQSCLLFATPWTAACQGSLFLTISQSLPKFMFILSVAIQLSHPLTSSSPSALNLSQYHRLFQWVVCSHQMIRILGLQCQHQSFQWIFRVDLPYDWLVWSPCYPRDFQESSLAPQLKASVIWHFTFFMVQLSQWYGTTRKTIALTIQTFVGRVMFLLFNTQPFLAWGKNAGIYSVSDPISCLEDHMKLSCFHLKCQDHEDHILKSFPVTLEVSLVLTLQTKPAEEWRSGERVPFS